MRNIYTGRIKFEKFNFWLTDKLGIAVPAVDKDSDVVVPVEENELLLPQHDKNRVAQLNRFRHDEKKQPQLERLVVSPAKTGQENLKIRGCL